MKKTKIINFLLFSILVFLFSGISVFVKNILITNFNNTNLGLITIDYVKNYGAAFSLFQNQTSLLLVISITILLLIMTYVMKNLGDFTRSKVTLVSLLSAGILCNLSERLLDGYVTDYIRINFIDFPIFNISDIFINISAVIIICNILFNNEKQN